MPDQQEAKHRRLIGGVFGLPDRVPKLVEPGGKSWLFQRPGTLRVVNARSAFFLLGQTFLPHKVWLPSYLCEAVVQGFQAAKVAMEFFPVNDCLRCENSRWLERVQPGDLVLRINYFGFQNTDPVFWEAISRGAWIVDDAAQALLTEGIGDAAHFVVYSPRKFIGVPDGGFLVSMIPAPGEWPALQPVPPGWWLETFFASQLRRDFELGSGRRDWFPRFQAAEQNAPKGPFAMSEFSGHLLDHAFNYSAITQNRRANYLQLLKHLHEFALFQELPAGIVPLGFPVRLHSRDAVLRGLMREQVFPPIHWALNGLVPDAFVASHNLARETMTLPCDQRYDGDDMRRISEVFLRSL
jgi:hypothetical protein